MAAGPRGAARQGRSTVNTLKRSIDEFRSAPGAERNLYDLLKQMLCSQLFEVCADPAAVVIDSPIPQTRSAPDLTFYLVDPTTGKPLFSASHVFASIEVKRGNALANDEEKILEDKSKYVTSTTRFFYLIDQTQVIRLAIIPNGTQIREAWDWTALEQQPAFTDCFRPLGRAHANLTNAIDAFKRGETGFAYVSLDDDNRREFIDAVRVAANTIRTAITQILVESVVPQVRSGINHLDTLTERWGQWSLVWTDAPGPTIECEGARDLDAAGLRAYEAQVDIVAMEIEPFVAALKLETAVLPRTAERMGLDGNVSLLSPLKSKNKLTDSGKAFESLAYETASLILSRMLMVRFAEDHNLLSRYICNGGVVQFAGFAQHFKIGSQGLLREVYRKARELYASIFSPDPLDWAVQGDETALSDALLHAMWLLSRWDFSTVHGDILSGVYDKYLDPSKRRALGEVYTRPEICRYMLERCKVRPGDTLLDPACGSGTFLVEHLHAEITRLRASNALSPESVQQVLSTIHGLDLNPFSVVLTQIQLLWQLLEVFSNQPIDLQRKVARKLIPYLMIEGGHSSLAPFDSAMETQANYTMDFGTELTGGRKYSSGFKIRRRFKEIATTKYDAVVANPPYIRAHRRTLDANTRSSYARVMSGQVDLYCLFLYRALRVWLKEGRRTAFIIPVAVLEADYARLLREVILEYKIIEIVDLESLRKITFRGIKRPTVILVIENSPGSDEDDVIVKVAGPSCYDVELDTVKLELAPSTIVKRKDLLLRSYTEDIDDEVGETA
jgi:hypothetical protein